MALNKKNKFIQLPENLQAGCLQYLNLACAINMFKIYEYKEVADGMQRLIDNNLYVYDILNMKNICIELLKLEELNDEILLDIKYLSIALNMFADVASLSTRPCGMWYLAELSNQ